MFSKTVTIGLIIIAYQFDAINCKPWEDSRSALNNSNPYYGNTQNSNYNQQYHGGGGGGNYNNNPYNSNPTATTKSLYPTLYPQTQTPPPWLQQPLNDPYRPSAPYNPNINQPHQYSRNFTTSDPNRINNQFNHLNNSNDNNHIYNGANFGIKQGNPGYQPYGQSASAVLSDPRNHPYGQSATATFPNPSNHPYGQSASATLPNQRDHPYGQSGSAVFPNPRDHPYGQSASGPLPTPNSHLYGQSGSVTFPATGSFNRTLPTNQPTQYYNNVNPDINSRFSTNNENGTHNSFAMFRTKGTNGTFGWSVNQPTPQSNVKPHQGHSVHNFDRNSNDNNYNQNPYLNNNNNNNQPYSNNFKPSAPLGPFAPTYINSFKTPDYDPNGIALAPFPGDQPNENSNNNLFNYNNMHRRLPSRGGQGIYDSSQIPLAPFPG